jgi:hypothetical protein
MGGLTLRSRVIASRFESLSKANISLALVLYCNCSGAALDMYDISARCVCTPWYAKFADTVTHDPGDKNYAVSPRSVVQTVFNQCPLSHGNLRQGTFTLEEGLTNVA